MLMKATTVIYIETEEGPAEERAAAIGNKLEGGLAGAMEGFPEGSVEQVDVEHVLVVSDEEAQEKGLVE